MGKKQVRRALWRIKNWSGVPLPSALPLVEMTESGRNDISYFAHLKTCNRPENLSSTNTAKTFNLMTSFYRLGILETLWLLRLCRKKNQVKIRLLSRLLALPY